MLSAIIALARPLVIWLVQAGLTAALYSLVDALLNKIQDVIRDYYGISDNDAGAVFVNILLDAAAFAGVGTAVVAKKIPLNVAKRLGLDASAPAKKAVSTAAAAKIGAKDAAAGGKGAKNYLDTALKVLGLPAAFIWLTSAVANIVEPGIYKPEQTNAVYKSLGIPYQYPTGSGAGTPGGFEPGEFADYVRALETAGAASISNPCKAQNVPFSRDELSALVDCIYGQETAAGRPTTAAKLKPKLAQYIRLVDGRVSSVPTGGAGSSSGAAGESAGSSGTSGAKVFTGILSQGVVGSGTAFNARPDDLIESVAELRAAAQNNLAAYLAALPSKVVYEVKVVPSVVTKDGFKQTGTTQRIAVGVNTDGTTKYRNVTNKFAVIAIYAVTDKGTRTKLTQITLGPTNSAKLIVAQTDLRTLESSLPALVTTSDVKEVQNIATPVPERPKLPAMFRGGIYEVGGTYYKVLDEYSVEIIDPPQNLGGIASTSFSFASFVVADKRKTTKGGSSTPAPVTAPVVSGGSGSGTKPGANATTLYEWYQAQGSALPSVEQRSLVYEGQGLGPRSYYTGTAEQNTKLLNALKAR